MTNLLDNHIDVLLFVGGISQADDIVQPRKKVGVVIVVCRENLSGVMLGFTCDDAQYHVYKKCDHELNDAVQEFPPALLSCTKFYRVPYKGKEVRVHADYLTHIIKPKLRLTIAVEAPKFRTPHIGTAPRRHGV